MTILYFYFHFQKAKVFSPSSNFGSPSIQMTFYRSRVLAALKELHRTRRVVFEGDEHALQVTKQQIRDEFRKNASETNQSKIEEAITLATDVAKLLRTTVVQIKQKEPGSDTFEMRVTKDTILPENTMFDPTVEFPEKPRRRKCSDSPTMPSANTSNHS